MRRGLYTNTAPHPSRLDEAIPLVSRGYRYFVTLFRPFAYLTHHASRRLNLRTPVRIPERHISPTTAPFVCASPHLIEERQGLTDDLAFRLMRTSRLMPQSRTLLDFQGQGVVTITSHKSQHSSLRGQTAPGFHSQEGREAAGLDGRG